MTDAQLDPRHLVLGASPRPMIVADNAHVTYKVFAGGKPVGARSKMFGQSGGIVNSVPALRGVSFTASEGETVGVVGHNGSGKSTLFRAMAGLIPTTEGRIWAADRPVLLGVNAALMPELSGENNIKLGLLAMGFTAAEAAAHVDEIADFAELNEFISHPMRTYSSGMGARLRFAIASARPHSILLLDEALAVGDRRFRLKSEERIRGLRDAAGLVMIVSHSAGSLRDTCERGLWVHKGELRADGAIKDVVAEYTRWTKNPTSVAVGAASSAKPKPLPPPAPVTSGSADGTARVATGLVPITTASNPRALARRERYLQETRNRRRRRGVAIGITAVAVVLAVGAGAAVALVTRQSDRIEIEELRTAASNSPAPTPSATALLPVINAFTAPQTAFCDSVDSNAEVVLSWDVTSAATVSVTAAGADGIATPLLDAQPIVMASQPVPFDCTNEALTYTLVTSNNNGQSISSTVVVSRELPPEVPATPEEPPVEDTPVAPPVEPTEPPVEPTNPPVEPTDPPTEPTDPPMEPTDPPVEPTEPPVEPTPEPPPSESPPVVIPDPEGP